MRLTAEKRLENLPKDKQEAFNQAVKRLFHSEDGTMVLTTLCALFHPMESPQCENSHETYAEMGAKEVTSLIVRRALNQIAL